MDTNPSQVSSQKTLVLIYQPRNDGKLSDLKQEGLIIIIITFLTYLLMEKPAGKHPSFMSIAIAPPYKRDLIKHNHLE